MCGICGRFDFRNLVPDKDLISAMCETIAHRGPDDEGIFVAPHIGLGQRRLTIIDLAKSACPPLCNEDQTIWMVFNGEIYNFRELRSELRTLGHRFSTDSDTEVIIHLYEEYGEQCLEKLRGMFAFALYDQQLQRLFCARDRLGKKPFCYAITATGFIFGSEIKAILKDPEIHAKPNLLAIDNYLSFSYIPSPETAFEGIKRLPPGHFMILGLDGKERVERYWVPPKVAFNNASEEEIENELLVRLKESVKLRMVADVPLGAFLSGGIDSATVVALMAQESNKPIKTFSIGFEDQEFNELPYAKLLAAMYGTEHHELVVRPEAAEILPLLVRHYNEPFADSSALPSYYVAKMTRKFVAVALSGDGGDESFGGYDNYGSILSWNRFDLLPQFIKNKLGSLSEKILAIWGPTNFTARAARAVQMFCAQDVKTRRNLFGTTIKNEEKDFLYSDFFKSILKSHFPRNGLLDFPFISGEDELAWLMRHDQNFYLPDCLMVKTDIASMACSLEVRSPFLDHKLIEFAATIPSSMKRDRSGGKLILRKAVKNLLPEALMQKPKTGFSIPLARWLRKDLSGILKDSLLSDRFQKRGLFENKGIQKMVQEHLAGSRDWSNRLWALMFLELWFREFID